MKRTNPAYFTLSALVCAGVVYAADLIFWTNPSTGFASEGEAWVRHAVLALLSIVCGFGRSALGPMAVATLRVRSRGLSTMFTLSALMGFLYGAVCLLYWQGQIYRAVLGAFNLWYGVWALMVGIQMREQQSPTPTKNVLGGILAAVPFCIQTAYRVLVNPSSLHRMGPFLSILSSLFAMLWMGVLLRALYIALVRVRAKWMYYFGMLVFLFSLLELVQTGYSLAKGPVPLPAILESLHMFMFGLVTAGVSVSLASKKKLPVAQGSLSGKNWQQGKSEAGPRGPGPEKRE